MSRSAAVAPHTGLAIPGAGGTGSGGGGGPFASPFQGGEGGSGLVLIAYPVS